MQSATESRVSGKTQTGQRCKWREYTLWYQWWQKVGQRMRGSSPCADNQRGGRFWYFLWHTFVQRVC